MTGMGATIEDNRPRFPVDGPERTRFLHHIEHQDGWEYRTTTASEADHPGGWKHMATKPPGWELNTDHWPLMNEVEDGCTRVAPGVIRHPNGRLVAHWRRQLS